MFIEAEHRSVEEKETFSRSYRRLDQIFAVYEKTGELLLLERSYIVVGDCVQIHTGSVRECSFFSRCLYENKI